jgi:hypothetical protein
MTIPKIVFEPNCFADFTGTQEELDELVKSITKMFEGKTLEEIMEMGIPISDIEIKNTQLN